MSIHTSARYYFLFAKNPRDIFYLPISFRCSFICSRTHTCIEHFQRLLESAYRALQTPIYQHTLEHGIVLLQLNISTSTMKLLKSCCPTFPLDSYLVRNFLPTAVSIASVIVNIVHIERNPTRRYRKRKTIINTIKIQHGRRDNIRHSLLYTVTYTILYFCNNIAYARIRLAATGSANVLIPS